MQFRMKENVLQHPVPKSGNTLFGC
jgi:hypothetical protein